MSIYDFSEYQGTIDFGKVKGNAQLIILRVQAGSTHLDNDYQKYALACKDNGIPFGTYAYAKFTSVADAKAEAENCYNRMDKETVFVVVDVEAVTTTKASELVSATQAYVDYLHSKGVKKVGLYSGESFYKTHYLNTVKADFIWIANYGVNDGKEHRKPSIPCDLWQYSSVATESGVIGHVDIDTLNGTKPLSYFTGVDESVYKGIVSVEAEQLNLRTSPDDNGTIIRQLKKGETYKFYDISKDGWYSLGANQWAYGGDGKYLKVVSTVSPTPAPKPVTPAPAPKPPVKTAPKPVVPTPTKPVAPPVQPKPVIPAPVVPQPSGSAKPPVSGGTVAPPVSANTSGSTVKPPVIPVIPTPVIPIPVVQTSGSTIVPVPPVIVAPIVDTLAKQIEDAVMKDPQLQKSIIQKLFSFIISIFK